MSRFSARVFALSLLVVLVAALAAMAGEGPNAQAPGGKRPPADATADAVRLAADLASWGRAAENPAAVALAAHILASTSEKEKPKTESKEKANESKPEAGADTSGAPKKEPKDVTSESLFAEAKALCGGSADDLKIVEAIAKMAPKIRGGALRGCFYFTDTVSAYSTRIYYNVMFRGGELAWIDIQGDGDTDLDLFVFDQNGNLIAQDIGMTDHAYVQWVPGWTGPFRIEVRNLGSVWNRFRFRSN